MVSKIKQKGFTIVELLIVIVVIAILAAISIVAYNNVTQKARDDGRVSDARNIVNALASYHSEKGEWLDTAENAEKDLKSYDTVKISNDTLKNITKETPDSKHLFRYQFTACKDKEGDQQTGAKITFYKEADAGDNKDHLHSLTAGTGC